MTRVTATTVELIDPQANHRKFYRTYTLDTIAVFQWGRIDTVGQFGGATYASPIGARLAAERKIEEKMADGYGNKTVSMFEYADAVDLADKESLKRLNARLVTGEPHGAPAGPAPMPAPTPQSAPAPAPPLPQDRHAEFTARALTAISLAVTDEPAAMVQLALLREQWQELEEIHERAQSYLQTLTTMLLAKADA